MSGFEIYPDGGTQLWHQYSDESSEHFALFGVWLDAKCPRLRKFAREQERDPAAILEIASRFEWDFRARAFNAWKVAIDDRAIKRASKRTAKRRTEGMVAMLDQCQDLLTSSLVRIQTKGDTLKPRELAALVNALVKNQQLLGGEATERLDVDLDGASEEALDKLRDALLAFGE